MNTKNVTKYNSPRAKYGENSPLEIELAKFKSGEYANLINACRSAYQRDKKLYSKLKMNLPAVTFCGTFNGAHKKDNLNSYNNIVLIDIDHISKDHILKTKQTLINDEYVTSCWVSPSGGGLKVLFKIDANSTLHKFYFDKIVEYLRSKYGIESDLSGSDVCRLCFVSFDEKLYYDNTKSTFPELEVEQELYNEQKGKNIRHKKRITNNYNISAEVLLKYEARVFNETEGKNKRKDRDLAKKIVAFLLKKGESITGDYNSWLKVGFAIANSFTYDIGQKFYLELCRMDGPGHDEEKSLSLLQHCYRVKRPNVVNFATVLYLATQKGFIANRKPRNVQK